MHRVTGKIEARK